MAKKGTPSIMPGKPKSPPPTMMANITQKLASLVVLPRILGPMIFPSICCRTSTIIMNLRAATGSIMRSISADGTIPIKGPKKGMMFVRPTITLMSIAIGSFSMFIIMKQIIPIMMESRILPFIKPPKVWLLSLPSSNI